MKDTMNNKRVVITGIGAISPLGHTASSTWEAVTKGVCGINTLRGFEEDALPISVVGQVKDFDPLQAGLTTQEVHHYDRFCQFAVVSAMEAMADSGLVSGENIEPYRLGVYIGSGIGGMQTFIDQAVSCVTKGTRGVSPLFIPMVISNVAGGNVAIRINAQGPNLCTVAACATSTISVGEALLAIQMGRADAILAGGTEACITKLGISGFANCKALATTTNPLEACLPFDVRRHGFVMAEGAAMLVLEELEHARKRGANILAEVCGYGHTCDAYHYTAPRPDGTITARCLTEALEMAGYKSGENLYINAHGTGTLMNDSAETKAIKLALGDEDAKRASISSTKSMTGHMIGATGAMELIFSALALKHHLVPPTIGLTEPDPVCDLNYTPLVAQERQLDIALSDSLGFGGHNAAVALRPYYE